MIDRPLRIGFDLDGVGYRFTEAARQVAIDYLGARPSSLVPPTVWHFLDTQWGLDVDDFWEAVKAAHHAGGFWDTLPPYPGYVDAAKAIIDRGHDLHIVTSRPGYAASATRSWLRRWGVPYSSLTLSSDKSVVPTDLFLDDRLSNLDALADAGTLTACWGQPWNTGAVHHPARPSQHALVTSWTDLLSMVDSLVASTHAVPGSLSSGSLSSGSLSSGR